MRYIAIFLFACKLSSGFNLLIINQIKEYDMCVIFFASKFSLIIAPQTVFHFTSIHNYFLT